MRARTWRRRAVGAAEQPQVHVEGTHAEGFVIGKVMQKDREPEEARGASELLHASSMIGMCVRRFALASISGGGVNQPGAGMRIVWALGRAAEKHVRKQFIAAGGVGILGRWACTCGETVKEGLQPESGWPCPRCRGQCTRYTELGLVDPEIDVIGSPDLVYVRPDNGKVRIVEIKSMNKKDFDVLHGPVVDHVVQCAMYRRLARINGMDVDSRITIVYVCKDFTFKPYQEFFVEAEQWNENLDRMWADARSLKTWKSTRKTNPSHPLPSRVPACHSVDSPCAKRCPVRMSCFARG